MEVLSRRHVRHAIIRAVNARVAELRDDRRPVLLVMARSTFDELLIDSDPNEQWTMDFEGRQFTGIPVAVAEVGLEPGVVQMRWPESQRFTDQPAGGIPAPDYTSPVAMRQDPDREVPRG
jgi:hypothetical protein